MDATIDTLNKIIDVIERRRDQRLAQVDDYDLSTLEGKSYAREDVIAAAAYDVAVGDVRVYLNLAISEAKAREAKAREAVAA